MVRLGNDNLRQRGASASPPPYEPLSFDHEDAFINTTIPGVTKKHQNVRKWPSMMVLVSSCMTLGFIVPLVGRHLSFEEDRTSAEMSRTLSLSLPSSEAKDHQATQRLLMEEASAERNNVTMAAASPESEFYLPDHLLDPGELAKFTWKSGGKQVDEYAHLVGLPSELTAELVDFCQRSGLMDAFWSIAYGENENEIIQDGSIHILDLDGDHKGKWSVMTPGQQSNWEKSDMRWYDVADEEAYEETLQVLKRGGFDTVLDSIGNEFQSDGLMIVGLGFIAVSHSSGARPHADQPGFEGDLFDFLFPLVLPHNDTAHLSIGDDEQNYLAPVEYTKDVGILIGCETQHQTGDCDYRDTKGLRVAVSIWIADLGDDDDELLETIAGDGMGLFPNP